MITDKLIKYAKELGYKVIIIKDFKDKQRYDRKTKLKKLNYV
jgi:hypothetical protein